VKLVHPEVRGSFRRCSKNITICTSTNSGLKIMASQRDYYFPNTEPLALDEMRVIALGTGRPFVRRGQANCSWLIELGNGEKFIFDFGSGSQANFTALEIPHQDVTAYFATHLHADHVGDFAQVWIGSWTGGRVKPLVLYGPSGPEPKYGTEHFVRKQMESLAWDTDTRLGLLPDAGAEVEIHEFDFRQTGVVYDHSGVVIKSFPAVHIYDGPVSYRLEWNELCFVFSGDTTPSRFFIDNAQGADLLIHECFNTVKQLVERSGYPEKSAKSIGTIAHTAPEECGKVLNLVKPRQAVVFHFFNDFDTAPEIEREIRKHYQGPLALAQDLMVFNVTRDHIRTRLAITPTLVWPNKERHDQFREASRKERPAMSRWLTEKQLFPKS
jgi:ribonuclease Z